MVAVDSSEVDAGRPPRSVRSYTPPDQPAAIALLDRCGGRFRVRRGSLIDTAVLPGVVALEGDAIAGLVTYRSDRAELELVVLAADPADDASRNLLIDTVVRGAAAGHRRIVACTSNADFTVQRSLQLAGFRICAVRAGSIDVARSRLAPDRLPVDLHGVAVRDEIEFELQLL